MIIPAQARGDVVSCEQHLNDQAEFNRLLIEENRRLRAELDEAKRESSRVTALCRLWMREASRLAERDGWVSFGTHADPVVPGRLEFDGVDECGEPLWERPVQPAQEKAESKMWLRRFDDGSGQYYRYAKGTLEWSVDREEWKVSSWSTIEQIKENARRPGQFIEVES